MEGGGDGRLMVAWWAGPEGGAIKESNFHDYLMSHDASPEMRSLHRQWHQATGVGEPVCCPLHWRWPMWCLATASARAHRRRS